jgi:hypothetical protein
MRDQRQSSPALFQPAVHPLDEGKDRAGAHAVFFATYLPTTSQEHALEARYHSAYEAISRCVPAERDKCSLALRASFELGLPGQLGYPRFQ